MYLKNNEIYILYHVLMRDLIKSFQKIIWKIIRLNFIIFVGIEV
jgi:hypothetical protein